MSAKRPRFNRRIDPAKMLSICPMLVPLDFTGNDYDGVISAYGQEFRLKIKLAEGGLLVGAELQGDLDLYRVLNRSREVIEQHLRTSRDLPTFLMELQTLIESQMQKCNVANAPLLKPPTYYSKLIDDLNCIGWDRLSFLDDLLTEIHIKVKDQRGRPHNIVFKLPAEFPEKPPQTIVELPRPFEVNWAKSLAGACQQLEKELPLYQSLWDVLDEVDRDLWIMEPESPQRKDTMRRISLGKGISLVFNLDPLNPLEAPMSWQLLGNDKVTDPLQDQLNATFHNWNINKSFRENWETLLGFPIPSRESTKLEDIQSECHICYSYKLDNETPEKMCENCKKEYHLDCLIKCFRGSGEGGVYSAYNLIFGTCLNCEAKMTISIPINR